MNSSWSSYVNQTDTGINSTTDCIASRHLCMPSDTAATGSDSLAITVFSPKYYKSLQISSGVQEIA